MSKMALDPSPDEVGALGRAVLDRVMAYEVSRQSARASDFAGVAERLASTGFDRPPPEEGAPLDDLLDRVVANASLGYDTGGRGFMGFIPGGGLPAAAAGDFLACALNRFVNVAAAAPAMVQLEAGLIRWMAGLFDLPPDAAGILTSGGSIANLAAVVTAREAQLGDDIGRGVVYVSDQAHASVLKAARIAGLRADQVRVVPTGADLRLDLEAVAGQVAADRRDGRRPFLVVASAGTTNTGTVDPLGAVADLCRAEGLWFHADAAYGGFFQLTDRGRARLAGIERADSITLDPHKALFLPYGTGCLLVRDGERLRQAHDVGGAHYLQDTETAWGLPDFSDYSPELSREFRGLRLWLPLHLHGVGAFRTALDEKLDLTERVRDALAGEAAFLVEGDSELTVVAFRLRAGDGPTAELMQRVNAEQRVLLSSTNVHGRFLGRVCILSFRTHADRVDEAIEALVRHGRELDSPRS